jgi:hypothetical protein
MHTVCPYLQIFHSFLNLISPVTGAYYDIHSSIVSVTPCPQFLTLHFHRIPKKKVSGIQQVLFIMRYTVSNKKGYLMSS